MQNISRKIAVAKKNPNKVEHAEIAPVGNSANEKKKISALKARYKVIEEYDNVPLPGFTVTGIVMPDVWEVIDPRGFTFHMDNRNLSEILKVTGITEGLIQQMCVYSRENSNISLTLLPITSAKFEEVTKNTVLIENKITPKTVEIGSLVSLQNGVSGKYLGIVNLYSDLSDDNIDATVGHFYKRYVIEVSNNLFYYSSNINILTAQPPDIAIPDNIEYLNSKIPVSMFINWAPKYIPTTYYSARDHIRFASKKAVSPTIRLVEIDSLEACRLMDEAVTSKENDVAKVVLEKSNGEKYVHSFSYSDTIFNSIDFSVFKVKEITDTKIVPVTEKALPGYRVSKQKYMRCSLDNFVKFYKIEKCISDTETYF